MTGPRLVSCVPGKKIIPDTICNITDREGDLLLEQARFGVKVVTFQGYPVRMHWCLINNEPQLYSLIIGECQAKKKTETSLHQSQRYSSASPKLKMVENIYQSICVRDRYGR